MKKISDYTRPLMLEQRPEGMPNIVLLMADEQRHDTICALGHRHMSTPSLDRLAREGCAFVHAYSPNPICVPARHNVLTGLYARHHGMPDMSHRPIPAAIPRLPQILADRGWHCEAIGKMHFAHPRTHHGFHRMQLMEETFKHIEDDDYAMYLRCAGFGHVRNLHGVRNLLYWQPQRSLLPEEHCGSSWVGDRCVEMIRNNRNRPFFLWAGWIAPHPPLNVPESFAHLYDHAAIPEPTPRENDPSPRLAKERHGCEAATPEKIRRIRQLYYSQISLVDKNVGKILRALEETGQMDNTLIIYTSDHGEMLGDNGAWHKDMPNDPSIRIPLLIRFPRRLKAGSLRLDYADLNDLLPTILDAAGIPLPDSIPYPGESLLIPDGGGVKDRTVQYVENHRNEDRFITLRGPRFKYNYWFDGPREELYDLNDDPHEISNLLKGRLDTEAKEAYEQLKEKLTAYETRFGLPGTVKDGKLAPYDGPRRTPWPPEEFGLNWQFPQFPHVMDPQDAAIYQSDKTEVLQAVKDEPTVKLSALNLDFYESAGGDPDLVKKIREKDL